MSDERLFTAVLDYFGKPSVSQFRANSLESLPTPLERSLEWARLKPSTPHRKLQFMEEDEAAAVNEQRNVWCLSPTIGDKMVTIHLVLTAQSLDGECTSAQDRSKLFTVILDYLGGTYISQMRRVSPTSVLADIDSAVSWDAIAPVPKSRRITAPRVPLAPVPRLEKVWRFSGAIDAGLAIVHIIDTDEADILAA